MVEEVRKYLFDNHIIDSTNKLNVDFLGENPVEFSIVPSSINPIVERFITGDTIRQFQFQLISQNDYSKDVMQNMANSSFYENLYNQIELLNKNKVMPNITGAYKIECLSNGAIMTAGTNTARYSIQMRILYYKEA